MIETTVDTLAHHLTHDLGIQEDDLVFLFSGVWGLGKLAKGANTITDAFQRVLPRGLLLVPTFSYSWSKGEAYDSKSTPCPDMGAYANSVWKNPQFVRTNQPNFSVAALKNDYNQSLIDELFQIDDNCFGEQSIFGNTLRYARNRRAHVLLLGGAFNDCLFRCTYIHYSQQLMNVPYRYQKSFPDPAGSGRSTQQLVRFLSSEEYEQVNGHAPTDLVFPVKEDFSPFGVDLEKAGKLVRKPFAYYESRMARIEDVCDFFTSQLRQNIFYCLTSPAQGVSS